MRPIDDSLIRAHARREFLRTSSMGLGATVLASLLPGAGAAAAAQPRPRARRVIFLFMAGAPSQLDLFDYKPRLTELEGKPLPQAKGGPLRFYIPDYASCNTDEIDECANVKFVDHIEITKKRGFDNRPEDEEEHAKLHGH